ncbi:MAG TPA: HAMP domain-containing sensor histidine kinase [Solirubrobacteraceae bacterium]|nr:HAMP domain-containing sensor histidine kinase [Solirubrobacteraceae bacterium]
MPAIASEFRSGRVALERWAMRERPRREGWRRLLPRPTVRLRLTLLYGSLFLIAGALLLAITYGLVSQTGTGQDQALISVSSRLPDGLKGNDAVFVQSGGGGGTIRTQGAGKVVAPVPLPNLRPPGVPISVWKQYLSAAGRLQRIVAGTTRQATQTVAKVKTAAQQAVRRAHSAQLSALLTESGIALGIMAIVSIGLGWLMAGRALAPIRLMNARVREMSADRLHERLALAGRDDELKELGDTFDGLLGRLEQAFESQRAFVANASHELRTPVTVERTLVEVALADPDASIDSLRTTLGRVLVAGEQQERTIEALLTLARSQRGLQTRGPVDLREVAGDAADGVDPGIVHLETDFRPATTIGDPALVERLVSNLLRNAVQHNKPGGWARASTDVRDGRPTVTVVNTGPVVEPDEVEALLEPFRRLNGARARHDGGIGLGMSIVDAIAVAHRAELAVTPRRGGGLAVVVAFPRA